MPPPRPLRTPRASFPARGSSRSNAPFTGRAATASLPAATSRYYAEDNTRLREPSPTGSRRLAPAATPAAPMSTNSCFCVTFRFLVTRDPVEVCPLSRGVMCRMEGVTPIQPIIGWPSLPPPSFTRSPIGSPCGSLSRANKCPPGDLRAYHVPLVYPRGLGPSSTPVVLHLRQVTHEHLFLTTYLLVQACRPLAEAFSIFRLF